MMTGTNAVSVMIKTLFLGVVSEKELLEVSLLMSCSMVQWQSSCLSHSHDCSGHY